MLQIAQSKAGDFSQNLAFKTMDATKLDYEDGKVSEYQACNNLVTQWHFK